MNKAKGEKSGKRWKKKRSRQVLLRLALYEHLTRVIGLQST